MLNWDMRYFTILLAILAICLPLTALAQEDAPVPRPRPDRGEVVSDQFSDVVVDPKELAPATPVEDTRPLLSTDPQPFTLSAKISEEGTIIPDGLVWRIFDTKTDDTGQLALLEKSEDSIAVFSLKPGDYVVHVAYGRSQATDTIRVDPAPTSHTIVLDSGALRLHAAIAGDIDIPTDHLGFDIYATGDGEDGQTLIVENLAPNELIHLNAGVYQVVSQYGELNAEVRADLRVDPGQITDATLYHHASQINFKLVSEVGGEAIVDVDWTVKTSDGTTIYTSFGAFPIAVLAEGDYLVIAKRGENVYNREFQVTSSPVREIELLTTVY